jgi:hypothetical protein
VSTIACTLSVILVTTYACACTSLEPKNPVTAAMVCGYAVDATGDRITNLDLQLVLKDNSVIAEAHADNVGNFHFAPIAKGSYYLVTVTKGWSLGRPVSVPSSKTFKGCSHPLIVRPALGGWCGGSVSKKGYHAKFATRRATWQGRACAMLLATGY